MYFLKTECGKYLEELRHGAALVGNGNSKAMIFASPEEANAFLVIHGMENDRYTVEESK